MILGQIPWLAAVRQAAGYRPIYVIGGAIRDALLGRPCRDFDFLVSDALTVAQQVAQQLGATFVRLHEQHQAARVVVRRSHGRFYLDFSTLHSRSLTADLRCRDFTINALAVGPLTGCARTFDPCGGRVDATRGMVRMTSRSALANDPIRIVRAYRFAAVLGFRLHPPTRRACRELAPLLQFVAAERIGAETLLLLGGKQFASAVRALAEDGVLAQLMPPFARTWGVEQGGVHEFDVAEHSLRAVEQLAAIISDPASVSGTYATRLGEYLADEETRVVLVLATLLHDVGKPDRRRWGGDRWRFLGHEEHGAEVAEHIMQQLSVPRRLRRRVNRLIRSHMRLLPFMQSEAPTPRARRRFMRDLWPDGAGAVLLSIADRRALRSQTSFGDDAEVLRRMEQLLTSDMEVAPPHENYHLPVSGGDLIALGLTPGPLFGEILRAAEEKWLTGALRTREDILAWIADQFARKPT
ncbi:MAG: HD domain-containing protein [Candidatus Zipacnadales bacterium]